MLSLKERTVAFCANPTTVKQPQGVVIRKFYNVLVVEAKLIFGQVSAEVDVWLLRALAPLTMQLKEHEETLERRLETLRKIVGNVHSFESRTRELEKLEVSLRQHVAELETVRQVLIPYDASPARQPEPPPALQARVA
jgi:hypothetical protein